MNNQSTNTAYSQRTIPQTPTTTMSATNGSESTTDPRTGNNAVRHMEVWRPLSQLTPPELCDIIVKTDRHSIFAARLINGEILRLNHGVWTPVAGAAKWIPYPHNTLNTYYAKSKNKDIPLEVMFGYLLKEKHDIENELKEFKCSDMRSVNDDLRLAYQQSETKNASLVEANNRLSRDNKELQSLIATRNDELSKADQDLEECYAIIADLKRKLKEQQDNTAAIAYEHRINELSRMVNTLTEVNKRVNTDKLNAQSTAEQRKQRITDLEHTITELKKNPKPVININPAIDGQYLAKYNILSTQFTKMRNLTRDILARIVNTNNKGERVTPEDIHNFNIRLKNITSATPKPVTSDSAATQTAPVSGASAPEPTTPPRPRIINIPRASLLRLPHIGEATVSIIEPLLKRFNVYLS